MMRYLLITLMMVCAMPSSSDARRYKRHAHVHTRHAHHHVVDKPSHPSFAAEGLASYDMVPFSRQEEVRFTGIDISDMLKPMPSEVLPYAGTTPIVHESPSHYWLLSAFLMLITLMVGIATELRRRRYLSPSNTAGVAPMTNRIKLMQKLHERYLRRLSSLT